METKAHQQKLKDALSSRAERAIPATIDLQLEIMREVRMNRQINPLTARFQQIAAILTLLVIATTAVYAVAQGMVQPDPGIKAAQAENLVKQINQTRTIAPSDAISQMNIALDYAYADINRIAVAYHISGVFSSGVEPTIMTNPTLIDDQGRRYLRLPSTGQQATNATIMPTTTTASVPFTHSGIMSFDASILTHAPKHLNLNLQIEVAYTLPDDPSGMILAGVARFDFDLPFNAGRTIPINQTVNMSNLQLDFKRLVLSPSATRLEVCYDSKLFSGEDWLNWDGLVTLEVGGTPVFKDQTVSFTGAVGGVLTRDNTCRALVVPNTLMKQTGKWVFTINEFRNTASDQQITGPWRFTLEINR